MVKQTCVGGSRGVAGVAMLLALMWLLWPVQGAAQEDQSATALIDQVIAAYGGEAALRTMTPVRQTGRTVSRMRGGVEGTVVRVFQPPDRLRVEITYPGEPTEVRILDRSQGWKDGQAATGPLHGAMLLQAARLALPLLLYERKADIRDLGSAAGPTGTPLRRLALALRQDLAVLVDVDPESGRILRSHGFMHAGGATMEFSTAYSEFETRNGVLVPLREEQYAMGHHIGHTVIDRIEASGHIGPEAFQP